MKKLAVPLGLLASSFFHTHSFAASEFISLGDLPGGNFSSKAYAVTPDGSIVVGESFSSDGIRAYRWTLQDGMVNLGVKNSDWMDSSAIDVSNDGSIIVGSSWNVLGFYNEAFLWTQAGGIVTLGDLPGGGYLSNASAVSGDGSVVVGSSYSDIGTEAFRWTQAEGMVALGTVPGAAASPGGGYHSIASGVNVDGSVIVGGSRSPDGYEAFRWTQATGMVGLGHLPGLAAGSPYPTSFAYATNENGTVVVGKSSNARGFEAFRWTQAGGMVAIGELDGGGYESTARGVSADGSVVVGDSLVANYEKKAFRWTQETGIQSLEEWLADSGVTVTGWTLPYYSV